jgi:molybdopterin converting factor subunit 1
MSIRILFFASLADKTGMREMSLDSSAFTNIDSIVHKLSKDFPSFESHRASILISINSEFARPGTPVCDGDEIAFFPPVSGG